MEAITKSEAKENGLAFYFTGKECRNGHIDKRRVSSGRCHSCEREHNKTYRIEKSEQIALRKAKYREENREKILTQQREHYWANRERMNEISREYYRENKARMNVASQKYYQENREALLIYAVRYREQHRDRLNREGFQRRELDREADRRRSRNWAKNNPEKARARRQRRYARQQGADGNFTGSDVQQLLEQQNWVCANPYCDTDLHDGYHVDHMLPLSRGGSNYPDNLQCLCPSCNLSKGAKTVDEWLSPQHP